MNTFNESNTIEAMLIEAARKAGWDYVPIADVPRNESQILVEPWLVEALRRNGRRIVRRASALRTVRKGCGRNSPGASSKPFSGGVLPPESGAIKCTRRNYPSTKRFCTAALPSQPGPSA